MKSNNQQPDTYTNGTLVAENRLHPFSPDLKSLENLVKSVSPLFYYHSEEKNKISSPEIYLKKTNLVNAETNKKIKAAPFNLPQDIKEGQNYFLELEAPESITWRAEDSKTYVQARTFNQDYLDLQYWFFFANRGPASANIKWLIDDIVAHNGRAGLKSAGSYEGDWKQLVLRVNTNSMQVEQLYFPDYKAGTWLPFAELQKNEERAVIYISRDSHNFFPDAGNYNSEPLKFNLYTSTLEFSLKHETNKGEVFDAAKAFELISAPWLDTNTLPEPAWLNMPVAWGKVNPAAFTRDEMKTLVKSSFGTALEFLLSKMVLEDIVDYLLNYFVIENKKGTTGPKFRTSWYD